MHMDKIESVKVDQSILGRIFDYGKVTVQGTGAGTGSLGKIDEPIAAPLQLRPHHGSLVRPVRRIAAAKRMQKTAKAIGDTIAMPVFVDLTIRKNEDNEGSRNNSSLTLLGQKRWHNNHHAGFQLGACGQRWCRPIEAIGRYRRW
jgi:hypothetical protein